MINIQKSQLIDLGDDRSITVYQDFSDPKKYYLVPIPRFVNDKGQPAFQLTKYKNNDGNVSGICYFDVELTTPDGAWDAAKAQLGGDIIQGQFDWVNADAYFIYDISGERKMELSKPSLYGKNRVTFSIELKSNEEVTSFENAFGKQGGSLSPFSIEYNVNVLTKLTGVTAKVSYDAEIAVTYETQYEDRKNTWGQTKQVAVGVKEKLKESGAGDVQISWNIPKTPEADQRVHDWAWTTLENYVADAIETARQAAGGSSPVESTTSFEVSYTEDQVIEWAIVTANPLEAFAPEVWEKVHSEVENQQLAVNFGLLGDFKTSDGKDPIENVVVSVKYITRTTGNSFTLLPTADKDSAHVYVAPGDVSSGSYNPNFEYQYQVNYTEGEPFLSDWIASDKTEITITPNLVGVQKVKFIGANIPFSQGKKPTMSTGDMIDQLIIDFFFKRPGGMPNKTQQKVMTDNGESHAVEFSSFFNLPITNTYTYRYTFLMASGKKLTVNPQNFFGSDNRNNLMIENPFELHSFALRAKKVSKDDDATIDNVNLLARYVDNENKIERDNSWDWDPPYDGKKRLMRADTWEFNAVDNKEGAYYELNGEILFDDDTFPVNQLKLQARYQSLTLAPNEEPYSLEIKTALIDWKVIENVELTVFQMEAGSDPTNQAHLYLGASVFETSRVIAPKQFTLLKPVDTTPSLDKFYLLRRPRTTDKIEYYYTAQYIYKDGTTKFLKDQKVENQLVLQLPSEGDATEPQVVLRSLNFTPSLQESCS